MRTTATVLICVFALSLSGTAFAGDLRDNDMVHRLTAPGSLEDQQHAIDDMQALTTEQKKALVPQLVAKLKEPGPLTRENAAEALGALDDAALPAVGDLQALKKDPLPDVRNSASISLARLGDGDPAFVQQLIAKLETQPANTGDAPRAKIARYEAADALGFIGAGPHHIDISLAIPALGQTAMGDSDVDVKNRAAWALGNIGKQARSALPSLRAAARDPAVNTVASWAIDEIQN